MQKATETQGRLKERPSLILPVIEPLLMKTFVLYRVTRYDCTSGSYLFLGGGTPS